MVLTQWTPGALGCGERAHAHGWVREQQAEQLTADVATGARHSDVENHALIMQLIA
jgi:hypothetical protein